MKIEKFTGGTVAKWLEPADRLGNVFIGFRPRHIHIKLITDVKLAVSVDVKDWM